MTVQMRNVELLYVCVCVCVCVCLSDAGVRARSGLTDVRVPHFGRPVASTLQLIAALIQSSHLSPKHKEAVEILKGQAGFWHCISACVPQRPAPESDHEPERSQYLAEQAALQVGYNLTQMIHRIDKLRAVLRGLS
jgi:hypothetical protein